jgi:KDO2-lipid IV(A) lauroyltransferase
LGDLGGWAFYRLSRRRRSIALDNIQKAKENGALPSDVDTADVALKSFRNLGRTTAEAFCLLHRGVGYFRDGCDFENWEPIPGILEESARGKRGLVFLTAHAGNWELSPAALTDRFGFKMSVVGRTQGRLSDEVLIRLRSLAGGEFIYKDGGARAMLATLKSGGALGTLFDQAAVVGPGSALLTFMGRPALTTTAPLRLAAKTGSTVIPLFCRRQGDRHVIEFARPLVPPQGYDRDWVIEKAQGLNDTLADFIRRHPDQWMWSHRRWKMPKKRQEVLPGEKKRGREG